MPPLQENCAGSVVTNEGKVLNEDEVKERIEELRKLMIDDENVRNLRQDDAYILRFLHFCNFDVDEALKKMKEYYDLLLNYPDWFITVSPLEMKEFVEMNFRYFIDGKDKDGRPIYVCKIGNINPNKVTLKTVAHMDQMWLETVMDDPEVQAAGVCVLIDLSGYSWKIFKWLTPHNLKVCTKLLDLYPVKQFKMHVVNTSILVNASIKLVWPFLSQRIKDMIFFHFDDWDSLHQHVSPEELPPEYGGLATVDLEKCQKQLFEKDAKIAANLAHHRLKSV